MSVIRLLLCLLLVLSAFVLSACSSPADDGDTTAARVPNSPLSVKPTVVRTVGPTRTARPTRTASPTVIWSYGEEAVDEPTPTITLTPTTTSTPTCTPTLTITPTETVPPTATPLPRRLESGTVVDHNATESAKGQLRIENGTSLDAVAVLTAQDSDWFLAMYVRSEATETMWGVPDGVYVLYFMMGEDWDADSGSFTRKTRRSRFEDTFAFRTTQTEYTGWTVTLHPVSGGDAKTDPVSEGNFPSLK